MEATLLSGVSQSLFWLYIVNILLVLTVLAHLLYHRRSPPNLAAWLLVVVILPFIGALLYLFFGSRKLFNQPTQRTLPFQPSPSLQMLDPVIQNTQSIMQSNGLFTLKPVLNPQFIHDSHQAYQELCQHIENAQHSIYIESYILEADDLGLELLNKLTQQARQGVQVYLLLDALGSFSLYQRNQPLQSLIKAGGHVAFFHPILSSLFQGKINLRNHRKLYAFDEKVIFTGGMNLSKNYLSHTSQPKEGWPDLLIRFEGMAVTPHIELFKADWAYCANTAFQGTHLEAKANHENAFTLTSTDYTHMVPSGADIAGDTLFEVLLNAIHQANHHITLVTPYFIPDNAILKALILAIKRRVKVTLISPETSDHLIFDLGRSSYMRELAEHGAEILLYTPNMLHAKLFLFDQHTLCTGSANLDYRSLFINQESVNLFYQPTLIRSAQNWVETLKKDCQPYQTQTNPMRRRLENLTRIIAPIL